MSSFEANAYTAKPANSITVTKPIIQSNLHIKRPQTQQEQHILSQQPKRIQPLIKAAPGPGASVFHLKSFSKSIAPSHSPEYSRIEVTKKKAVTKFGTVDVRKADGGVRRISKEVKRNEVAMGNEGSRMATPGSATVPAQLTGGPSMGSGVVISTEAAGTSAPVPTTILANSHPQLNHNTPTNIPLPVAQFNSGGQNVSTTSSAAVNPAARMASIINPAEAKQTDIGRNSSPNTANIQSGPRVVSTSSSKTITGGITIPGANPAVSMKHHAQHRPAQLGARTAVIQSPIGVRGQQQPIVRHMSAAPTRTIPVPSVHPRPHTPNIPIAGAPSNPTTVQITIHQPKQTTSNAGVGGAERLIQNANQHFASSQAAHGVSAMGSAQGSMGYPPQQPVLQKLVISQTPSGQIQQNRTTIPMPPNHEANRNIIATNTLAAMKKPMRPVVTGAASHMGIHSATQGSGQHDYKRSEQSSTTGGMRKPGIPDPHIPNRPSVSIHTLPEHQRTASAMYSSNQGPPAASTAHPGTMSTAVTGGSYIPSTIQGLENIQNPAPTTGAATNNYKSSQHSYNVPQSHSMVNSSGMPTIISNSRPSPSVQPPSNIPTVVMGDNSPAHTTDGSHSGSPRPSILRKRAHEGPLVVNKIGAPQHMGGSIPGSPGRHHHHHHNTHLPLDKDNTSQSSTDTAMSSESPNQTAVAIKQEVPDAVGENGAADLSQPDVSPRKKPRKQLLNTAAELKDRHDSSTEEETETKHATAEAMSRVSHLPTTIPEFPFKQEYEAAEFKHPVKDEFVDREGVRWVKMRTRQADPMLCFYNCTWKSRNNHFQRHSDIKTKEERRPVVSELSNQKGIQQKASGWKFYHISAQFQEMIETEQALQERMDKLQQKLSSKIKNNSELCKIHEITQANKQRCSLTKDQLQEAKASMFSILDTHKPKIMEIITKNHSKRPVKKKERT